MYIYQGGVELTEYKKYSLRFTGPVRYLLILQLNEGKRIRLSKL